MKKFITFALLTLVLASCKKSSTSTSATATNTITATVDGTNYVFNVNPNIINQPVSGYQILHISAFNGSTATAAGITISIQALGSATKETYPEGGNSNNEFSDISYAAQYSSGDFYSGDNSTTNPVSVTVTSVNATAIQGTFKGDIYLGGDNTQAKKVLASGTFNVNF